MKFELKPYNLNATDNELIEDLILVAKELGVNTLSGREYTKSKRNRFHDSTITNRFGGWNMALEKAGLKIIKEQNITDEKLIEDLKRVANEITPQKLTQKRYAEKGKYTPQTITDRLGWNKTLEKLNLETSVKQNISDRELFENIEKVWTKLGRQPGKRAMIKPYSNYSEVPYINRYGSWRKALEAFVEYINSDLDENQEIVENNTDSSKSDIEQGNESGYRHKTKRDVGWKLRFVIMRRDNFKCVACGRNPATDPKIILHVDHIIAYDNGGETVPENLQTLCSVCNGGKGTLDFKINDDGSS